MKKFKFMLSLFIIVSLCISFKIAEASMKTQVLMIGETHIFKVANTKQVPTWTSNKKSIVTITKKGVATAKKAGTATIIARIGKKKYKYTVKVTKAVKAIIYTVAPAPTAAPISGDTPEPTSAPEPIPTSEPTAKPTVTPIP